jgi:CRP-like cAMP-binding protein
MRPGIETLRKLPLFASFDAALLGKLNELGDLARFGPGEVLFDEGDRTDQLNILLTGYITTARAQPGGGGALTDVIVPIRAIGFAAAMLGVATPFAARTVTSARLIIIPAAELRAMIAAQPRLGLPFLNYALHELSELTREVCQLKLRSSAQRLAEYLLGLIEDPELTPARFVLPYEKRFLAAKIGCSQENLSRAFAALRRVGVGSQQGIVIVRDVAALREFAGLAAGPRDGAGDPVPAARPAPRASAAVTAASLLGLFGALPTTLFLG